MPFLGLITSAQYQQELSQAWSMLDAAKQRELELLAVIEKPRKEQMDAALDKFVQESSQALHEHEANAIKYARDEIAKSFGIAPLVHGNYQSGFIACHRDCIDALSRMAEERRKK